MARYALSGSKSSAWLGFGPGAVGIFDDEGPDPTPGDVVALWSARRPAGPPELLRLALPPFPAWSVHGPSSGVLFVASGAGALKCYRHSYIGRMDRLIETR